jgi:hypothetical protein
VSKVPGFAGHDEHPTSPAQDPARVDEPFSLLAEPPVQRAVSPLGCRRLAPRWKPTAGGHYWPPPPRRHRATAFGRGCGRPSRRAANRRHQSETSAAFAPNNWTRSTNRLRVSSRVRSITRNAPVVSVTVSAAAIRSPSTRSRVTPIFALPDDTTRFDRFGMAISAPRGFGRSGARSVCRAAACHRLAVLLTGPRVDTSLAFDRCRR